MTCWVLLVKGFAWAFISGRTLISGGGARM